MKEPYNYLNIDLNNIFNYKYRTDFDSFPIPKKEDYYYNYIYNKFLNAFLNY